MGYASGRTSIDSDRARHLFLGAENLAGSSLPELVANLVYY